MNKKSVFTVLTSLMMVGCVTNGSSFPTDCVDVHVPVMCSNAPRITINTNTHVVAPRNFCSNPGDDIEVRVVPANGEIASVLTKPKDDFPQYAWLNGTNDPDANGFVLHAPDEADHGFYEYYILFADGYCIDPRITL